MKRYLQALLILSLLIIMPAALLGCSEKAAAPTPKNAPQPAAQPAQPPQPAKAPDNKAKIADLVRKGQQVSEIAYDIIMTGSGLSSESKVWLKQKKMKTDTLLNGQRIISIFDLSKGEILSYLPDQKTATKMKIEEYQGLDDITPIDYLNELDKDNFVFIGNEDLSGKACEVVMLTHGDNQVKLWISVESGLVLKIEDKTNNHMTTIDFKNLRFGPGTVPDSTFTLPQGIDIIDMNEIMKGQPKGNP